MNAQTEQLIYWKQRHDKLAEQHAKAVEALRLLADPDNWLNVNYDIPGEAADLIWAGDVDPVLMLRDVLAAIEEPTDA